jgi:MoxR-like ATPase
VQLKNGPIFTNLLLIDEINRAPPRTMNSLLEALEERNVSIANSTLPLKRPFITFATQNPLNIEGTESMPKVLTDRFLLHIAVGYPSVEEEQQMLRLKEKEETVTTEKVLGTRETIAMQEDAKSVIMPDEVAKYITRIVDATRSNINVVMGASPRADISFMLCGKAKALIEGRKEVTMEDIKALARPVLSHRIVVRSSGGVGVKGTIDGIIATVR